MALIYRNEKGSNLTATEVDNNFRHVTGSISDIITGVTRPVSASYAISASYARTSTSASYALTSSYSNTSTSASYALTSSYSNTSTSASYALSSSYSLSGSFASTAVSSSYALSSSYAVTSSYSNNATSASYALTASYALSASYEINYELSSSYAETASIATSASYALSSSYSRTALSASYALSSSYSLSGSFASTSTSASYALTASYALNGGGGGTGFPYNGNAVITGSLTISGSNNYPLKVNDFYLGRGVGGGNAINITIGGNTNLANNTTGEGNVAIGLNALSSNTTGVQNTAIGTPSLINNTTGQLNTAIGSYGLTNITTGVRNISLGYTAGYYLSGSSSYNICMGNYSGPLTEKEESNKLYINNAAGTPLIGGDFSTGVVTINSILSLNPRTTNPSSPASGSIIVSGSGADFKPYFWNGVTWNPFY